MSLIYWAFWSSYSAPGDVCYLSSRLAGLEVKFSCHHFSTSKKQLQICTGILKSKVLLVRRRRENLINLYSIEISMTPNKGWGSHKKSAGFLERIRQHYITWLFYNCKERKDWESCSNLLIICKNVSFVFTFILFYFHFLGVSFSGWYCLWLFTALSMWML